jgi:hypothetical protein
MHQHRPEAAYFVGDTSPAVDPVRYLQYIRHLHRSWAAVAARAASRVSVQQQQQQQQLPPLVVNTHGWVKGMGFDVLLELLAGLPVTHMVQIAAANPKKNLPPGCFWLSNDSQNPQQQQQQQQAEPALWLLPGLGGDQEAAQPAASEASGRSAATQGPQLPEPPAAAGGAKGRLHAVEQRALQWEALAQQCIDRCGVAAATPVGSGKAAAAAAAAVAAAGIRQGDELGDRLAAAVPFEIDVDDIDVQASGCPHCAVQLHSGYRFMTLYIPQMWQRRHMLCLAKLAPLPPLVPGVLLTLSTDMSPRPVVLPQSCRYCTPASRPATCFMLSTAQWWGCAHQQHLHKSSRRQKQSAASARSNRPPCRAWAWALCGLQTRSGVGCTS